MFAEHSQDIVVLLWQGLGVMTGAVIMLAGVIAKLFTSGIARMQATINGNHVEMVEAMGKIEKTVNALATELRDIDNRVVALETRCNLLHNVSYGRRSTDMQTKELVDEQ